LEEWMGNYTYQNFQDYLKLELYQRTDLETPTDYYSTWTNQSYINLATRKDLYFPEMEKLADAQTSDGTVYVEAPTDTLFIRTIFDDTSTVKLKKVSWIRYIRYTNRADTSAEDNPNKWTHAGGGTGRGRLYLYPTPDAAYDLTIYYRAVPARLSNSTDTTAIGEEWDEIILKMAVWQTLMRLKEYDKAEKEKEVVDEMIRDLRGVYDRENIDRDDILQPSQAYLNR
jgi:hypothetical protein